MKFATLQAAPWSLTYRSPLQTTRGVFTQRLVVVLALRDAEGRCAVAEAAPWPEFGTETAEELFAALPEVVAKMEALPLPEDVSLIASWLRQLGLSPFIQPALCFALECAALALISARTGIALARLFTNDAPLEIRVNALISAQNTDEAVRQLTRARDDGFNTAKIKVGAQAVEGDIVRVTEFLRAVPDLQFRLDANGAWSFDEACTVCERMPASAFEYIEDPLRHTHPLSLKKLRERCEIKLALDHSERDDLWRETRLGNKVYSFVAVKPQILGWTTRAANIVKTAQANDAPVVVTSCMESSLGLAYVAHAAAAFGEAELAHGIATAGLFEQDTLSEPLHISNGSLALPDVTELPRLLRAELRRALALNG